MFASTTCFPSLLTSDSASRLFAAGFDGVELSYGPYQSEIRNRISSLGSLGSLAIHNYFPRPEVDFTFNLASLDCEVRERSLNHAMEGIALAGTHNMSVASFHAGFLVDPQHEELGTQLSRSQLAPRGVANERFLEAVTLLVLEGERLGVRVLFENNVLTRSNLSVFGCNPFLLVTPQEMFSFLAEIPSPGGLLIDVAHLSISAVTLNFDRRDALAALSPHASGFHLSEDGGVYDDGLPISDSSWFAGLIPDSVSYVVLEVALDSLDHALEQAGCLRRMLEAGKGESSGTEIGASNL